MALTDYKPQFDNAYQEVFQKTLVAKDIMNTRFEKLLSYGASVARVSFDISAVRVRTVTRGFASTFDPLTDTAETLTINLEKEAAFHISDGEATQTGPLNPGEVIGKQVGHKVAVDLDGRCFGQVVNALYDFDNGDLTTATSTGVGITLNATTVPQMVARMPAKLRNKNNQEIMTNMALVVDSYAASDITQYLLGKNIDLAGSVFKNGYTGDISNAQMYVSENLTGEATLVSTGVPVTTQTVTIGGVVFTSVSAIGTTPGNVLFTTAADFITNLAAAINAPGTTSATYIAVSAADQVTITDTLGLVATATSATVLTIVGTGSGRLTLSETQTNFSWATNILHAYFGKKGAIDLVVQDLAPVDMRITTDRRGTNVFSSYLAGIKTFADGAKKFLDVLILVA